MTLREKNREFFKKYLPLIIIFLPIYYLSIKYNKDLFFQINGFQGGMFVYPMIFLSAMADGLFVLMISSAVYQKKKGYFWTFILAYFLSSLIVQSLKYFFDSGRPLLHYSKDEIFTAGERLKFRSFPSGHSASAMVLAYYLAEGLKTRWKTIIFIVGILAAVSRVYIGAHYPKDITTGMAIGFIVTSIVFSISRKKSAHANRPEYKYNLILISITGAIAAFIYLYFERRSYKPISGFVYTLSALFLVYFIVQIIREFFKIYKSNGKNENKR